LVDEIGIVFELASCTDACAKDIVEFLADFGQFCGMLLEKVVAVTSELKHLIS
jgi:hypothetical protein